MWTVITCLAWQPGRLADPVTWFAGVDHLWFLTVLMVGYLAAPLRRACPVPWWVVPVALWGGWFLFSPALPGVSNWVWFGGFFFFGAALGPHLHRLVALPWWVAGGLSVIATMGVFGALTGNSGGTAWTLRWLAISLAGVLLTVWLAARAPRVGWVETAGGRSMVFYVAHVPAISLAAWAWSAAGLPDGWAAYVGLLAVGVLMPWVMTAQWARGLFEWPVRSARRRLRQPR